MLTVLAGGLIFYLLIFHSVAFPVTTTDPNAVQKIEARISAAIGGRTDKAKTVEVDESELNSLISHYVPALPISPQAGPGAGLRDFRLKLIEDRVRAYVLVNYMGRDIAIVIEGKVSSKDGFLRFDPVSGTVGALPIPAGSLRKAAEEMVSTRDNQERLRLPPAYKDIRVENGQVVVTLN